MDVEWRKLLLTLSDHLEEKNVRYLSLLQGIPGTFDLPGGAHDLGQ